MEYVLMFYGHSVYFTFCGHLVYFSRFGILYQEKSGNPVWMADVKDFEIGFREFFYWENCSRGFAPAEPIKEP
jgi:hypothetical protein